MAWPSIPDSLIFSDSVQFRTLTWTKDAVAGRQSTPSAWGPLISCMVVAASVETSASHSVEQMVVSHVITLDDRNYPGLKIRDQALWAERGSILTIVGIEPAGDRTGRIWNLYCEERPQS